MRFFVKHIRSLALLLALLLLLPACQRKDARILSKRELSQVLCDVYLTETMLKQLDAKTRREWSKGMRNDYFQDVSYHWILDKHQISEDDFYASISHYSRHAKTMIEVLDLTTEALKKMQQDLAIREQAEIAAREKAEFDKKWQTVSIDEDFVALWAKSLRCYPDSVAVDTLALAALPYDSLAVDSLPRLDSLDYVAQYYAYWLNDNDLTQQISSATRYALSLENDSLAQNDTLATIDAEPAKAVIKQIEQPKMELKAKDSIQPLRSINQLNTGRELLLDAPTELRTDDRRSR